ncbi:MULTISPECIES: hypothetical protein [unclassified Moorena]|nr:MULTISPECIES: hypothetical protein [unclassified Moorena]
MRYAQATPTAMSYQLSAIRLAWPLAQACGQAKGTVYAHSAHY